MIPDNSKNIFLTKYKDFGEEKFYEFLIEYGKERTKNLDKRTISPADELLGYSDNFIETYRKDNDNIYLQMSKIFRKAAHAIHRIMINSGKQAKSAKFLRLVKCGETAVSKDKK